MSKTQLFMGLLLGFMGLAYDLLEFEKAREASPDVRFNWRMAALRFVLGVGTGLGVGPALPQV